MLLFICLFKCFGLSAQTLADKR